MPNQRADRLKDIQNNHVFDVVVVGGGVNGIGVYRELALQGLRVLLVERNDFCSGCSSAPSRMIHGGLRYLENGEFDLVRESLRERDALLKNAPHMVKPLPTMIPITHLASGLLNSAASFLGISGKPARRGALPVKLGLMLYDWVTRKRRLLPRHKFFSRHRMKELWPEVTDEAISAAVYHDAWISHPARLCLEMLQDVTEAAPTSAALNYAQLNVDGDSVVLACTRTGKEIEIATSVIVNATGAWLDATVDELSNDAHDQMVAGTKGSHLILDNPQLRDALNDHMIYFENVDGRVCIVFSYLGRVLAGSTDIRVPGAIRVRCEDEELNYIIQSLQQVFPDIPVSEQDVVFSFSGVRPLPVSDHDFTGRISRGHAVKRLDGRVPQFCMIGGKWTTFRAFSEQTADHVLAELGKSRFVDTEALPIGGGRDWPGRPDLLIADLIKTFGISEQRATHLVDYYGSNADRVQQFCADAGDDRPLHSETEHSAAEIRYLVRNEQVETLADIFLRRTSLAITGHVTGALIDDVAAIFAEEASLTDADIATQKEDLKTELRDFYGVSPKVLVSPDKNRSQECV